MHTQLDKFGFGNTRVRWQRPWRWGSKGWCPWQGLGAAPLAGFEGQRLDGGSRDRPCGMSDSAPTRNLFLYRKMDPFILSGTYTQGLRFFVWMTVFYAKPPSSSYITKIELQKLETDSKTTFFYAIALSHQKHKSSRYSVFPNFD